MGRLSSEQGIHLSTSHRTNLGRWNVWRKFDEHHSITSRYHHDWRWTVRGWIYRYIWIFNRRSLRFIWKQWSCEWIYWLVRVFHRYNGRRNVRRKFNSLTCCNFHRVVWWWSSIFFFWWIIWNKYCSTFNGWWIVWFDRSTFNRRRWIIWGYSSTCNGRRWIIWIYSATFNGRRWIVWNKYCSTFINRRRWIIWNNYSSTFNGRRWIVWNYYSTFNRRRWIVRNFFIHRRRGIVWNNKSTFYNTRYRRRVIWGRWHRWIVWFNHRNFFLHKRRIIRRFNCDDNIFRIGICEWKFVRIASGSFGWKSLGSSASAATDRFGDSKSDGQGFFSSVFVERRRWE